MKISQPRPNVQWFYKAKSNSMSSTRTLRKNITRREELQSRNVLSSIETKSSMQLKRKYSVARKKSMTTSYGLRTKIDQSDSSIRQTFAKCGPPYQLMSRMKHVRKSTDFSGSISCLDWSIQVTLFH